MILFLLNNFHQFGQIFDLEQRSGHKISNIGQYKMPKMNNDVCSVIFYSMTINSDGTVSACCSDWNQELIIGNTNENSLKEIWKSEKLKILQKLHLLKKRNSHSTFSTCNHPNTAQIDQIDNYAQKIFKKFKLKVNIPDLKKIIPEDYKNFSLIEKKILQNGASILWVYKNCS